MTKDIVVVTDTDQTKFAREVLSQVQSLERQGYTCEVKYAIVENDNSWNKVKFSALIHAYQE